MDKHAEQTQEYMRSERGAYMAKVYAEVTERGPIAAAELAHPGKRSGNWWAWGPGKATLEHLYDSGLIAIAGRRGFERLYDIAERVIPQAALDASAPPREEAMKQLICLGAKAQGVGTSSDIAGYFLIDGWRDRIPPGPWWERPRGTDSRRTKPIAHRLVSELVEEGRLLPARVEGWNDQAFVHTCRTRAFPRLSTHVDLSPRSTRWSGLCQMTGKVEAAHAGGSSGSSG